MEAVHKLTPQVGGQVDPIKYINLCVTMTIS